MPIPLESFGGCDVAAGSVQLQEQVREQVQGPAGTGLNADMLLLAPLWLLTLSHRHMDLWH